MNKVYIIVLNYNGWADTIECLESVLRNSHPDYQVVVVDNKSPDNSMEYLKAWAEGKLEACIKSVNTLKHLFIPAVQKPIPYIHYAREEAEKGGNPGLEAESENSANSTRKHPLIFIQSGDNLGFGGGNNVGIRYAMAKDDLDYIWLLNNDTVIERDSLKRLVEKAEMYEGKQKIGIIGSKLLYYDKPETINGIGGKYNKWFALPRQIGVFEKDIGQHDREGIKMDYVIGASMLVGKKFLQDVGLICEDYFLYFEELDWALRGKSKGWGLGHCWKSRVYHKEGSTIGSSHKGKNRTKLADYYGLRNRILFTRKFYPGCLWSVYLGFIAVLWNRIRRRQFDRINLLLKAIFPKEK